ncbi:MAG: hypothetical protein KBF73_11940 [Flavobacteriales bacterium]|nr:hypothetical protein [Flavobacteriales bacterium]
MARIILTIQLILTVLLHGLTPHGHHGNMSSEAHEASHTNATGILDCLGLIFQNGFDVDLTSYVSSSQEDTATKVSTIQPQLVAIIEFTECVTIAPDELLRFRTRFQGFAVSTLDFLPSGLRAPPVAC